jgi:SAM-dependent methyltransferase
MHPYLRATAAEHGLAVDLRLGQAEALPAADASLDAVVSTLVLCSVHDLQRTLAEVHRVLRPGGRFLFVEHVAAPEGSRLRIVQDLIRPPWQLFSDGCHPNRETGHAIEQAGFAEVQYELFTLPLPVIGPHIAGYAGKG